MTGEAYTILGVAPEISDSDLNKAYKARLGDGLVSKRSQIGPAHVNSPPRSPAISIPVCLLFGFDWNGERSVMREEPPPAPPARPPGCRDATSSGQGGQRRAVQGNRQSATPLKGPGRVVLLPEVCVCVCVEDLIDLDSLSIMQPI